LIYGNVCHLTTRDLISIRFKKKAFRQESEAKLVDVFQKKKRCLFLNALLLPTSTAMFYSLNLRLQTFNGDHYASLSLTPMTVAPSFKKKKRHRRLAY